MAVWRSAADRNTPRLRRRLVRMAKKRSTALSNDAEALERPAWIARQSLPHNGMLGGGAVVEDRVDCLSGWNLAHDGVEKSG